MWTWGPTPVPRRWMEWSMAVWGMAPPLSMMVTRERPPRASLTAQALRATVSGSPMKKAPSSERWASKAARGGRPAALAADAGECGGVGGPEEVGGLLAGVGEEADDVDGDVEGLGRVAGATAGFAVEVDEGAEAVRLAADDADGERQAEVAGAGEGLGRSSDAEADGQLRLQRPRPDALAGERGTVFALPLDVDLIAELEQEVELLHEELVVVLGVVAEERIGLDEGAAADDDLGAPLGDEVEGGEVLEDANGIVGAEHRYRGGKADLPGARGGGGQQDGRRGGDELLAVVFADAVDVDAGAIGELDLLEEMTDAFGAVFAGGAVGGEGGLYEGVDAYLHDADWMVLADVRTQWQRGRAHVPIEGVKDSTNSCL